MRQTKHNIWESMYELMLGQRRLFSDVRVYDICQMSSIHRSTFYRHFEDKYAVLHYGLNVLWQDYFLLDGGKRWRTPFTTADRFYEQSEAQQLMRLHRSDDVFLEEADTFFIKKMKEDVSRVFDDFSISVPKSLVSHLLVGILKNLEEWREEQPEKVPSWQMDAYYQELFICQYVQ